MVFMVISKAGKTSIVESNTKVNAKYYCNVLSKNMISEMKRLVKQNMSIYSCNAELELTQPSSPMNVERQETGVPNYWSSITGHQIIQI